MVKPTPEIFHSLVTIYVLVSTFAALTSIMIKSKFRSRGFMSPYRLQRIVKGIPVRNSCKARVRWEKLKPMADYGGMLLTGLLSIARSIIFTPQNQSPKGGSTQGKLVIPTSMNQLTCLQQSHSEISQDSIFCEFDKKLSNTVTYEQIQKSYCLRTTNRMFSAELRW